jgi:hypothetical protein
VVRVLGYRSRGPGSILGPTSFSEKWGGLERGPFSLVRINIPENEKEIGGYCSDVF